METDEFRKSLRKLPPQEAGFIGRKLGAHVYPQLREEPFFGPSIRKLRGYAPEVWRYRIGQFRVFYSVDETDRTVVMKSVDLRRDAYR